MISADKPEGLQVCGHADRPLAPIGAVGHVVLGVAGVVEDLALDQLRHRLSRGFLLVPLRLELFPSSPLAKSRPASSATAAIRTDWGRRPSPDRLSSSWNRRIALRRC